MIKIYVLLLEDNKFYIGQSKNIEKRLYEHQNEKLGSEWTKLYKPIKIIEQRFTPFTEVSEAMLVENEVTLEYMNKFGWKNVRGGDFCTLNEEKLRFLLCANSDLGNEILPIGNPKKFNLNIPGTYLFSLKLIGNKYFIGRTENLKLAIINEYNGLGSEWTKEHKPLELFSIVDITKYDKKIMRNLHNSMVINYMKRFGFDNIRGGDFYKTDSRNHKNKVLNYTDIFK